MDGVVGLWRWEDNATVPWYQGESGGSTVQLQGEVRGRGNYAPPVHTNWIGFMHGRHFQVNKR